MADLGDRWITNDLERVVNGILCSAGDHPKCETCTFICAKWIGDYDTDSAVKRVREILDAWERSEAKGRCGDE